MVARDVHRAPARQRRADAIRCSTAALLAAVAATGGRLCVVEDHWAAGRLGDAALAALAEAGADERARIGAPA